MDKLEYTIEGVVGEILLREYLKTLGLSVTLIKKQSEEVFLLTVSLRLSEGL